MRRIVLDNSVVVAAFYPDVLERDGRKINLTARARPLLQAVENYYVQAYAPHSLVNEFLKVSHDKAFTRQGVGRVLPSDVEASLQNLVALPVTYIDEARWLFVWDLTTRHRLPPTDAWFLACAMEVQGELWVSHRQKDGFMQAAQAIYGDVHLLSDEEFKL